MTSPLVLRVNTVSRDTRAAPEMPLLYYLRNELGLKGTRFGCGGEACGACTVLVDGAPAYACTKPLLEAAGREVTTVECAHNRYVAAVQDALVEERAGQCGYCLSGIVMSAAALLMRHPNPAREHIVQALDRHLCRCGAHPRILRAVARAARRLAAES
jgi:nicotinate dehydrogenase subunit A